MAPRLRPNDRTEAPAILLPTFGGTRKGKATTWCHGELWGSRLSGQLHLYSVTCKVESHSEPPALWALATGAFSRVSQGVRLRQTPD